MLQGSPAEVPGHLRGGGRGPAILQVLDGNPDPLEKVEPPLTDTGRGPGDNGHLGDPGRVPAVANPLSGGQDLLVDEPRAERAVGDALGGGLGLRFPHEITAHRRVLGVRVDDADHEVAEVRIMAMREQPDAQASLAEQGSAGLSALEVSALSEPLPGVSERRVLQALRAGEGVNVPPLDRRACLALRPRRGRSGRRTRGAGRRQRSQHGLVGGSPRLVRMDTRRGARVRVAPHVPPRNGADREVPRPR
eukprot:9231114-Alexandrium_andersonii.AAC.1